MCQYRLKKYFQPIRLKGIWQRICANNDRVKPTQYYEYYKHLFFSFYLHPKKALRWRFVFYYISDGKDECIVPLVINEKRKMIRGISNYGRLDYEDVISSTNENGFVREALNCVFVQYSDFSIHIENINEDSLYYAVFGNKMSFFETCVKINLPGSYDDYYDALSKHQRQNIRTAYNKLTKENFEIYLHQYDAKHPIPTKVWMDCERMYEKRHDANESSLKKWYIRQSNPFHHILHKMDDHRIMVLSHDGVPMAYMAGLCDYSQKCFFIPRLCINEDFYKYSPGIILIVETIKKLINENMTCLDLMRGDEAYKIAMGGIPSSNYVLKCPIDELKQ